MSKAASQAPSKTVTKTAAKAGGKPVGKLPAKATANVAKAVKTVKATQAAAVQLASKKATQLKSKPQAKVKAKPLATLKAKPQAKLLGKRRSKTAASPSAPSAADALFSKGRQRVLAVLFGEPGRSFFTTEIIALAHAGSGSVQRELASLAQADLLVMTQKLMKKYYQANQNAPAFPELRALVQRLNASTQG